MTVRTVLVANRAEIAVRIIRTLRALGLGSVAVFSDADADAPHVRAADTAVRLGTAPSAASYLDIEAIIDAARRAGADAVHPGYGFLSENPTFAQACVDAGLTWIGPTAATIALMGDKIAAKRAVVASGVAVLPGSDEAGLTDAELADAVRRVGFPALIKPSAGGGGKGMRRVDADGELAEAIAAARREARGAFGDGTLLVERFVARPRHVEVQVFADTHGNVVHLGERECSLQRRHQKVVEEAPSVLLDERRRAAIGASAVKVARACGYVGAGTVEFLMSVDHPDEHWFLEMNTRLQVEHPVTEAITGLDLVEWQIRVASGEPLPVTQDAVHRWGHAVEARVYAEDPDRHFLPTGGRLLLVDEPTVEGVRIDAAWRSGLTVSPLYDPLLAKVVAWGPDRATALGRLDRALAATTVLGVTTNIAFLRRLIGRDDVRRGELDTELIERHLADLAGDAPPPDVVVAAALLTLGSRRSAGADPWDALDGWRLGEPASTTVELDVGGQPHQVEITGPPTAARVAVDGGEAHDAALQVEGDHATIRLGGRSRRLRWTADGDRLLIGADGAAWEARPRRRSRGRSGASELRAGAVVSPMPGTVLAVHVTLGQAVRVGEPLVSVEAMKMEHTVRAPVEGRVVGLPVAAGQSVALEQVLAVLAAHDGDERDGEPAGEETT